jgi:hypothetical protein
MRLCAAAMARLPPGRNISRMRTRNRMQSKADAGDDDDLVIEGSV